MNLANFFIKLLLIVIISVLSFTIVGFSISASSKEEEYFSGYGSDKSDEYIHQVTRLNSKSDDAPSITFLVHGQGGNASHWSYDGDLEKDKTEEAYNFSYNSNSLIENLRKLAPNAEVLLASMQSNIEFYLYRLEHENYDLSNKLTKIDNVSGHIIVVFEAKNPYSYHRVVYEELHTVIDRISYDILYLTGKIPTVNLISHSRGGLTSMMYASGYRENGKLAKVKYFEESKSEYADIGDGMYEIPGEYDENSKVIHDHPFNVAELFSLGTPYHGTDWDKDILFGVSHMILGGSFGNASAKNILDETIQDEIHSCWEIAVGNNPNLNLNAIAGTFDLTFILGLLSEDYRSINKYVSGTNIKFLLDIIKKWGDLATITLTAIDAALIKGTASVCQIPYVGWVLAIPVGGIAIGVGAADLTVAKAINNLRAFELKYSEQLDDDTITDQTIFTELSDVLKAFADAFDTFGMFVGQFTKETNLLHDWGDLFIDTKSQCAEGFSNVETYEKLFTYVDIQYVVNGNNECIIDYEYRTFDYKKTANQPAIPHNLEARDSELINYICSKIELGVPKTIYNYDVLSNETIKITDVILPSYYFDKNNNIVNSLKAVELGLEAGINGLDVSYIDNNSFANFQNLKKINIPNSVVIIGDKAFENCVSLDGILHLPDNLENLGFGVFNNCLNISGFSINDSNGHYFTKDGVLYSYYDYCSKNGMDFDIIKKTYGNTLISYPCSKTDDSFIMPIDIVNIADYAFANNKYINSITLNNIVNIGDKSFENCSNLETINDDLNVNYVGESALNSTNWLLKPTTSNKIIGNVLVRYNSNEVEFDSYGFVSISANAFENSDVEEVIISPNTIFVGKKAFSNCEKLLSLTFLSLDNIVELDFNILENHLDQIKIFVPNSKISQYYANINFENEDIDINPIITIVSFDTQGGCQLEQKNVFYGEITSFNYPSKAGYDFNGWILDDTMLTDEYIWDKCDDTVTLYAQWSPASYIISFDNQGGYSEVSSAIVFYKSSMPSNLVAPIREGYRFDGYYSNYNGTGTKYYDSLMNNLSLTYEETVAICLYAHWIPNSYKIVYDMQGGENGTIVGTGIYGETMPEAVIPQRTGYKFLGYFSQMNGLGKQYYSYSMDSSRNYDIDSNLTLYAYWGIEKFEIRIGSNSQWVDISSNQMELKNTQVSIPYGTSLNETINNALIDAYIKYNGFRTGYELIGFYQIGDDEQKLIDWGYYIPDLGEDGDLVSLEPKWKANVYNFSLDNQGGKVGNFDSSNNVSISSYSSSDYSYICFVPSTNGNISIWTTHKTGDPYLFLYDAKKVELTSNDDCDDLDSEIIYNVKAGVEYYIGFRTYGSIPCEGKVYYSGVNLCQYEVPMSYCVTYDTKPSSLVKPYRNGYTFNGYYTEPNGKGEIMYNNKGEAVNVWNNPNDLTLYAYWKPNSYTITFNKQSGTNGTSSISNLYGSNLSSATKPSRTGYTFQGYYTQANGSGTKYYNSSMIPVKNNYDVPSNLTLYAYWEPKTYDVTLDMRGGTSSQSEFSSTLISYNREDIQYIYFVANESGTISLWTTHSQGDPYLHLYNSHFIELDSNDDGDDSLDSYITYKVVKGESYYVGFRAYSGNKTVGNVKYSGVSVTSYTSEVKMTYNQNPPSVIIPKKEGYKFDGYYTSSNGQGTKIYDSTGEKLRKWEFSNLTLYANWIATTYSYTGSISTTIYTETSIVDLSSAPVDGTYAFTILPEVDEITFKTTSSKKFNNFKIMISERSKPLILRFVNVSIVAPNNCNAISAIGNFKLTVAYSGTVTIIGGRNTSIGTGQGYAGIINNNANSTVALNGTGNLSIIGGVGSTGVVGVTGSKGSDGSDHGFFISNGGNGSNGGTGGQGGTGGKGGYAIYSTNVIIESNVGSITLTGGQGGTGGRGGDGGDGGRGGHAGGSLAIAMNGGDGGAGGTGGQGGTGGAGGNSLCSSYSKKYLSCVTPTVSDGLQGVGGRGGNGGDGGYGGANGPSLFADGSHGSGGSGGTGGQGGAGYIKGSKGSSGYTGGYYIAV